jgi:hypothetical protein
MRKQQRDLNAGVTEDDLNEIKQDISSLRFELLEIFKNNQFKVDVKQNPSKRKRGKLNLEKAMAKNMFEDSMGGSGTTAGKSIFDSLSFDPAKAKMPLIENENLLGHHKAGSKKSQKSNASKGSIKQHNRDHRPSLSWNKSNELIMQKEDGSKSKSSQSNGTPAMFRIANRIKKLTEIKAKKDNQQQQQHQSESASLQPNENNSTPNKTEIRIQTNIHIHEASDDNDIIEKDNEATASVVSKFIDDEQNTKVSTQEFISADTESYTERITEV